MNIGDKKLYEPQENRAKDIAPHEETNKKAENTTVMKSVGYFSLFRYTDAFEKVIVFIGMLLSIANGAAMPLFSLIFGNLANDLTADKSPQEKRDAAVNSCLTMLYLALGTFAASFFADFCWSIVSNRLNIRIRKLYLAKLMSQEMGWFDKENPQKMTTKYVEDIAKFQGAIGNMNYTFLNSLSCSFYRRLHCRIF